MPRLAKRNDSGPARSPGRRPVPGWSAALGSILVLAASAAHGSTVRYLPLERMAVEADQIFTGVVVGVTSQVSARRTSIHTFVTIEVEESLKGGPRGSLLTLRVLGGEAEGYRLVVAGAPSFRVGEEVLVFASGGAGRIPSVLGLAAGKFTLETDETTGERLLHRSLYGLTLQDDAGAPIAMASVWPRGSARLSEVTGIVRNALAAE